jgi:hypothetical protein
MGGAADWYRDMTRHGGIVCEFWGNWFEKQVLTVQHGVGERGARNPNTSKLVAGPETLAEEELARNRTDLQAAILAHPLDDAYHRERSPDWSKVTGRSCPAPTGAAKGCTRAATSRASSARPRARSGWKSMAWSTGRTSTHATASRCRSASSRTS